MLFKTKGMNRDLSVSTFNPEFSFENMNLRLSTNENNTLMSWVNEKGTSQINLTIEGAPYSLVGTPVGTAVLNHQLIIFTHGSGSKPDYIYKLEGTGTSMTVDILYNGDLKFRTSNPLETMVAFEADHIQKVYWTDGLNQPRLINIVATPEKRAKWVDTSFDFVPTFSGGKITVEKNMSGGGLFAPGVIQYCFTYVNKYGQQSNIVDISPLFYLSHGDRGASPEDKVTSSFKVTITEGDSRFDYIRLYSIQRTSLDGEPLVKVLDDIPITDSSSISSTQTEYENNVPLTLSYIKGEYPNKTLPVDSSNLKILSVSASNGTFNVTVTPKAGTSAFNNEAQFKFKAFLDGDTTGVDILSLQELINGMQNNTIYQGSAQDYSVNDYYAAIDISQELEQEIQTRAENLGNFHELSWDLVIDNQRLHLDSRSDILIYNFADQRWYVITSFNNINVTTQKVVNTQVTETIGGTLYIDNGTSGRITDPFELLFVGGKEISALTMMDKDNTLFLGNCTQKNVLVDAIQAKYDDLRIHGNNGSGADDGSNRPVFYRDGAIKQIVHEATTGIYSNTHTLKWDNRKITTFKGGDTYRFGFQLQKKTGEWLEPIFMNDVKNYYYPETSVSNNVCTVNLPYVKANIDLARFDIDYSLYKSIRPVMVYPTIADREVLCQGVLNPTVFNAIDRIEKYPYAQASWFFRPYTGRTDDAGSNIENITGQITEEALTENPDLTVEPEYFKDKTTQAYVVIVEVTKNNDYHEQFIKNGTVTMTKHQYERDSYGQIQEDYWNSESQDFWGCILLTDSGTYHPNTVRLALLSSFPWDPQVDSNIATEPDGSQHDYSYVYDNCIYMATSGKVSFPIYKDLCTYKGTMLYYVNPTEDSTLDTYYFKFYACDWYITHANTYYKVPFTHVVNTNPVAIESINGATVRFAHYSHVYSRTDVGNNANWDTLRRQIEIQNAENLYDSPFSEYDKYKNSCNGEFFIDQSIITLNSPEIDFDTMVQVYGNDDLKLRIVGAIPITAEVSAHDIITGSAKLELEHNVEAHSTQKFGIGELRKNVWHENSMNTNRFSSQRLVAEYIWNDAVVASKDDAEDHIKTLNYTQDFLIHPWHRSGSLNNDWRKDEVTSSLLKSKKESNMLFSMYTGYLQPTVDTSGIVPSFTPNVSIKKFENIESQIHIQENKYIQNYRFKKQKNSSSEINYYPNIDKILYNSNPYQIYPFTTGEATNVSSPVLMRYKSNSHAIIALNAASGGNIPILPYADRGGGIHIGEYTNDEEIMSDGAVTHEAGTTFWGDTDMLFTQDSISSSTLPAIGYDFLWLGELYKSVEAPYGGTSSAAIRANRWQIAGQAVDMSDGKATIYWTEGDTYYQRYDCLKTYPFTNEDPNQLVEILSFMCESHINIDGRYDKNKGQVDNTMVSPVNFNKMNYAYSQQDNYFTARKMDTEDVKELNYPNQLTYSKTKESGADVDLWTNVTLSSILELDGDKGQITSIQRFNNQLIAFQNTGISQILYNENAQISTTEGVPVEFGNSGKVDGKRYISNTIGCSNKWSIANIPSGIYFMDSHGKNIFMFNGQLNNLSTAMGFNTWCKQSIPDVGSSWTPDVFDDFVAYYDKMNQDILWINKDRALAYSEKLGVFTSFYDYGDTPYFCNFDDEGIWVRKNAGVWLHQAGNYCNFFENNKPFSTTLVGNSEPQMDKIFTNLEFRACVEEDGYNTTSFEPFTPFDKLETWNEYQHGIAYLGIRNGHSAMQHHTLDNNASLKRKFRIWRCDVPRDNAELNTDADLGVSRLKKNPNDRMRNPWLYLKLQKDAAYSKSSLKKTEIHDIVLTYFD